MLWVHPIFNRRSLAGGVFLPPGHPQIRTQRLFCLPSDPRHPPNVLGNWRPSSSWLLSPGSGSLPGAGVQEEDPEEGHGEVAWQGLGFSTEYCKVSAEHLLQQVRGQQWRWCLLLLQQDLHHEVAQQEGVREDRDEVQEGQWLGLTWIFIERRHSRMWQYYQDQRGVAYRQCTHLLTW